MTKQKILEEQVEALEKLLDLKQAIIEEQNAKISRLESEKAQTIYPGLQYPQFPGISIPSVWTVDPCIDQYGHQYPPSWNGLLPPPCNKCGKAQQQSVSGSTITISSGTGITGVGSANTALVDGSAGSNVTHIAVPSTLTAAAV